MSHHHFDLVFARREDDIPPRFVCLLEREAHRRGLIFVHCRNHNQAETLRFALLDGSLTIDCLVDYMGRSFPADYELGCAVKDNGGMVVDDPDRVRIYGDKATMHRELVRAGIEMPHTLIWQPDQPSRDLTADERALLGERFVCKPAYGSGAGGVVLNMDGSCAALEAARDYDIDDHYLLQEFVTPLDLDGRPAWFRVYNCFGRVFACFWHPVTHETALVTPCEIDRYGLHELERISQTIAAISGYTWFSTEIAVTERNGRRAFLPIDYLNNKCFMLTHGEVGPCGLPDAVAEMVAYEIAHQAAQRRERRALVYLRAARRNAA
ncbi:MAG TPA: hypothetical protein VFX76_14890 [Roseiflexaceae bacterium]|nr:hypothetical protein [Roseiflexaceae bacterium]